MLEKGISISEESSRKPSKARNKLATQFKSAGLFSDFQNFEQLITTGPLRSEGHVGGDDGIKEEINNRVKVGVSNTGNLMNDRDSISVLDSINGFDEPQPLISPSIMAPNELRLSPIPQLGSTDEKKEEVTLNEKPSCEFDFSQNDIKPEIQNMEMRGGFLVGSESLKLDLVNYEDSDSKQKVREPGILDKIRFYIKEQADRFHNFTQKTKNDVNFFGWTGTILDRLTKPPEYVPEEPINKKVFNEAHLGISEGMAGLDQLTNDMLSRAKEEFSSVKQDYYNDSSKLGPIISKVYDIRQKHSEWSDGVFQKVLSAGFMSSKIFEGMLFIGTEKFLSEMGPISMFDEKQIKKAENFFKAVRTISPSLFKESANNSARSLWLSGKISEINRRDLELNRPLHEQVVSDDSTDKRSNVTWIFSKKGKKVDAMDNRREEAV